MAKPMVGSTTSEVGSPASTASSVDLPDPVSPTQIMECSGLEGGGLAKQQGKARLHPCQEVRFISLL